MEGGTAALLGYFLLCWVKVILTALHHGRDGVWPPGEGEITRSSLLYVSRLELEIGTLPCVEVNQDTNTQFLGGAGLVHPAPYIFLLKSTEAHRYICIWVYMFLYNWALHWALTLVGVRESLCECDVGVSNGLLVQALSALHSHWCDVVAASIWAGPNTSVWCWSAYCWVTPLAKDSC